MWTHWKKKIADKATEAKRIADEAKHVVDEKAVADKAKLVAGPSAHRVS